MHIALSIDCRLPVSRYGGTQRVVWSLGKALARAGHAVTLLAPAGSKAPFGRLIEVDPSRQLSAQIPEDVDVVHFQNLAPAGEIRKPYIVTVHGNASPDRDSHYVYISADHARRHGSERYVYNGLEWGDYPSWRGSGHSRSGAFFLGKGAWKVKNLRGAIRIALQAGERLEVLGAHRVNFKMGFRFTASPRVNFCGMVGDQRKAEIASRSRALLFPVLWDEPFGLALIESMYYGAPVIGTPRGSLPEIVGSDGCGFLSESERELADALRYGKFSEKLCHERAAELFNSDAMARGYLKRYEEALNAGI